MQPDTLDQRLSDARFRLQRTEPFFGSLLMHLDVLATTEVPTAATDGDRLFMHPGFAATLNDAELRGVLLHELLHAALDHVGRRRDRDPLRWNVAADIVVNGIVLRSAEAALPKGHLRNTRLEHLEVEEVYRLLDGKAPLPTLVHPDLLPAPADPTDWGQRIASVRMAMELQGRSPGNHTDAESMVLQHIGHPQLDWRTVLWRHTVRSPADFGAYDRRMVHAGLYLEDLEPLPTTVIIAIDTSGSIGDEELAAFMGEVRGILDSYPGIRGELWYADTELYGPYDARTELRHPEPKGRGGTSFKPFCALLAERPGTPAVYLTDGHGTFPDAAPANPLLWVVAPGGLTTRRFPFGEVVRLVDRKTN
jgi:predicted metal-dependent peptidase